MLNNELYTGRLVWNWTSYVRDPRTGKRLARPNPRDEWEASSDESLRIIDDALWARVKAQQAEVRTAMARIDDGIPLNRVNRAQHLLSGLIVCGECGSTFAMRDARHYGCSNVRSKGTCANGQKVKRADLERFVGDAIRHRWMNQDAMARLRAEVLAERERIAGSSDEVRAKLAAAIKRKEVQVSRIVDAITEMGHHAALLSKLEQLQTEAHGLRADLDNLDAAGPPAPLAITDDVDALIQAAEQDIEQAISDPPHPDALRLREMVRSMIERITINRHESGAIEVDVRGAFAGVMEAADLVERHSLDAALKMRKAPALWARGLFQSGCGGTQ